jgi:hypothetical protein
MQKTIETSIDINAPRRKCGTSCATQGNIQTGTRLCDLSKAPSPQAKTITVMLRQPGGNSFTFKPKVSGVLQKAKARFRVDESSIEEKGRKAASLPHGQGARRTYLQKR